MRAPITRFPINSASWSARIGTAGFAFFLLKGLLWLLAPTLLALLR